MAKYKKESLACLLKLIVEICRDSDNEWFKDELSLYFSENNSVASDFPSLIRYLKVEYKKKGLKFYQNINDPKLKNDLIKDFVEMYFNHSLNDMGKFIQFTCYQMENLLNYYCTKSNSFEKIIANKNYYGHNYNEKFIVSCHQSFFILDKPKELNNVNLWAKMTFWLTDTNKLDWYKNRHNNVSNIINLRNEYSHRNSISNNEANKKIIKELTLADFNSISFYISILKEILSSFTSIDPTVKIMDVKQEPFKLKGVTTVGFINLDYVTKK